MNVGEFLARATALLGSAEQHASKVAALTGERDKAISDLSAVSSDRDRLSAEVQRLTGEVDLAKASATAATQAAEDAKACAESAKLEAARVTSSPSAQAAAVLAAVGHPAAAADTGSSANPARKTIDPTLTGLARAKAARAVANANR